MVDNNAQLQELNAEVTGVNPHDGSVGRNLIGLCKQRLGWAISVPCKTCTAQRTNVAPSPGKSALGRWLWRLEDHALVSCIVVSLPEGARPCCCKKGGKREEESASTCLGSLRTSGTFEACDMGAGGTVARLTLLTLTKKGLACLARRFPGRRPRDFAHLTWTTTKL